MPQSPEEKIAALAPELLWGGRHCMATDPIAMEYVFEGDPAARNQLAAVRLNAAAQVFRVIADATEKAAQILGQRTP
jgi:hypothetical protein